MTDQLSRRGSLGVAAGTAAAALAAPRRARAQQRPNVLFILADDWATATLSCTAGPTTRRRCSIAWPRKA